MRRAASSSGSARRKGLSSEDLELEEIELKRRQANKLKRQSRRSFRNIHTLTDVSCTGVDRSEKALTEPEPFNFATDARLRARAQPETTEAVAAKSHAMVTRAELKPTKPRPFRFHSKPAEPKTNVAPYVSLAAAVEQFQNKTPARFHQRAPKENTFMPQVRDVVILLWGSVRRLVADRKRKTLAGLKR